MPFKHQLEHAYQQNHIQNHHRPRKNNKWACVLTKATLETINDTYGVKSFIQLEKSIMHIRGVAMSHLECHTNDVAILIDYLQYQYLSCNSIVICLPSHSSLQCP
jgi:hypothetical protein